MFGIYRLNYQKLAIFIPIYTTICGLLQIAALTTGILIYKCVIPYDEVPSKSEGTLQNVITLLIKHYFKDLSCDLSFRNTILQQLVTPFSIFIISCYLVTLDCIWIVSSYSLHYGFKYRRSNLLNFWKYVTSIRTFSASILQIYIVSELGLYLSQNPIEFLTEAVLSTLVMKTIYDGTQIVLVFDIVLIYRVDAMAAAIETDEALIVKDDDETELEDKVNNYPEPGHRHRPRASIISCPDNFDDEIGQRLKNYQQYQSRMIHERRHTNEFGMPPTMREALSGTHVSHDPNGRVQPYRSDGINMGYIHDEPYFRVSQLTERPCGQQDRFQSNPKPPQGVWISDPNIYDNRYYRPWSYLNQNHRHNWNPDNYPR